MGLFPIDTVVIGLILICVGRTHIHVLVRHKSTSARVSCVTVASISVYTSLRVYESLRQYTKVLSVRGEKAQG